MPYVLHNRGANFRLHLPQAQKPPPFLPPSCSPFTRRQRCMAAAAMQLRGAAAARRCATSRPKRCPCGCRHRGGRQVQPGGDARLELPRPSTLPPLCTLPGGHLHGSTRAAWSTTSRNRLSMLRVKPSGLALHPWCSGDRVTEGEGGSRPEPARTRPLPTC